VKIGGDEDLMRKWEELMGKLDEYFETRRELLLISINGPLEELKKKINSSNINSTWV